MRVIELLSDALSRGAESVSDPRRRLALGQTAGAVGIVCNVMLCLGKAIVGSLMGSVSIVADAVNNLSDASSNVVSLLGFKLAGKPADGDHPYGHGRYEYLAGLTVSVLVLAIGINLLLSSVDKVLHPQPTEFGVAVVVVLVASMLLKLWMLAFNRRLGRRIASETLLATAVDSRNDVIATGAVLASAIVSRMTGFDLDGWMGAAVGCLIVVGGIGLVRDSVNPLLGRAPDPELVEHVRAQIMSHPGVLGTHDLMVHDYGPGRQFASAHVEMAGEGDVFASHDLLDNIEQEFKRRDGIIMTLHMDPIVTDDPAVLDLRNRVEHAVRGIDPRLTIHDLRTVPGPTHTNVIFDCVRPHDLEMSDSELKARIQEEVSAFLPQAVCNVTIDASFVSPDQ